MARYRNRIEFTKLEHYRSLNIMTNSHDGNQLYRHVLTLNIQKQDKKTNM